MKSAILFRRLGRKKLENLFQKKFFLFFTLHLMGAGCSHSLSKLCEDRFPEIEKHFINTLVGLKEAGGAPLARELAAVQSGTGGSLTKVPKIHQDQRDVWKDWSLAEVRTLQKTLVEFEVAPELHSRVSESLSGAADSLVLFNGYSQIGDLPRMVETLNESNLQLKKARSIACEQPPQ